MLHGDQGRGDVVLFAPAVKQREELVKQAGEDPEVSAPGGGSRIPGLGKVATEEIGGEVAEGFVE